jgi:hypothetical protein
MHENERDLPVDLQLQVANQRAAHYADLYLEAQIKYERSQSQVDACLECLSQAIDALEPFVRLAIPKEAREFDPVLTGPEPPNRITVGDLFQARVAHGLLLGRGCGRVPSPGRVEPAVADVKFEDRVFDLDPEPTRE